MNNMPLKLREECAADPQYKTCIRRTALNDHECVADPATGKLIEWEHAIIFAGRQVQEKWAIIPICWYVHRGPALVKEINVWLALNRATHEELKAISKVKDYEWERDRLNREYGAPGIPKRRKS